jgi:NitT/TauT family transport system substrate-binding protein
MGLVGLKADADAGTARHDYQVTMYGAPDEVVPLVVQGKADIALVPSNLAAVLYNQTKTDAGPAVQVAAINTLGVLEVVEAGDTVHSLADLAGKTIFSTGKGTTPEYVLDYLLTKAGLDPATDVTLEFRAEATEVAALVAATPGAVAVLPQPYVTVVTKQNPAVRSALSLTDEWVKVSPAGSQLITGVLVVRTAFVEEHPLAFAEFLADYEASTAFTNDDPAAAAELIAAAGIVPAAPVAQAAIPFCNITYIDGAELKTALSSYLQVLFDADPKSVGGTMPGDDFYYAGA